MKTYHKSTGYTLVELIVTLVIVAVLMALAFPALTGYIDKARSAAVIAEARGVLTASQATVTETYAQGGLTMDRVSSGFAAPEEGRAYRMAKQIFDLSETNSDKCEWRFYLPSGTNTDLPMAKISMFTYCNKRYCVTYRAFATNDEPAGWSEVTRASTLPQENVADGKAFLKSNAYDPDRSAPPMDIGGTSGGNDLSHGEDSSLENPELPDSDGQGSSGGVDLPGDD